MDNGPKLWSDLIKQAPPGSVLMGGAVVDYIVGVEPKDFDIFHTYKVGPVQGLPPWWVPTEANFNDPVWVEKHQELYKQGIGDNGQHMIGSVYEYMVDGLYKVQLIGVMHVDPKMHFRTFDHTLTLGRYSKNGMWVHGKVFGSIETKSVEYISKDKHPDAVSRSLKRAMSKVERYGWLNPLFTGFIANKTKLFAEVEF